jgi:hypothetical protein
MPVNRTAKPLPGIFIDKEEVNKRVSNYLNEKHPVLSAAIGHEDSKSAWYSLDQFEELMREMYYLNADGLRFYFGAYDGDDANYPGMLTVVLVPTYLNENTGKHTDIVVDDEADFLGRCAAKAIPVMRRAIGKNLDTLGLCPPSCDKHTFSYPL